MEKTKIRKLLPYVLIFLGMAYGIWPLDILPDIPLVGWIDDLGIVGTLFLWAAKLLAQRKQSKIS